MRTRKPNPATRDADRQDQLLEACKRFSGVGLPQAESGLDEAFGA
jgi:hypothetical protein